MNYPVLEGKDRDTEGRMQDRSMEGRMESRETNRSTTPVALSKQTQVIGDSSPRATILLRENN